MLSLHKALLHYRRRGHKEQDTDPSLQGADIQRPGSHAQKGLITTEQSVSRFRQEKKVPLKN